MLFGDTKASLDQILTNFELYESKSKN